MTCCCVKIALTDVGLGIETQGQLVSACVTAQEGQEGLYPCGGASGILLTPVRPRCLYPRGPSAYGVTVGDSQLKLEPSRERSRSWREHRKAGGLSESVDWGSVSPGRAA